MGIQFRIPNLDGSPTAIGVRRDDSAAVARIVLASSSASNRRSVSRWKASTYFARVCSTTASGSRPCAGNEGQDDDYT